MNATNYEFHLGYVTACVALAPNIVLTNPLTNQDGIIMGVVKCMEVCWLKRVEIIHMYIYIYTHICIYIVYIYIYIIDTYISMPCMRVQCFWRLKLRIQYFSQRIQYFSQSRRSVVVVVVVVIGQLSMAIAVVVVVVVGGVVVALAVVMVVELVGAVMVAMVVVVVVELVVVVRTTWK